MSSSTYLNFSPEYRIGSAWLPLKATIKGDSPNPEGRYEHDITRYALLILQKWFLPEVWNIVPQFRTNRGMVPDLVLEQLVVRSGDKGNPVFAPGVFVEFKSLLSTKDAIAQLMKSICQEYGPTMRSRGFLIGVEGLKWTIIEYHFIKIRDNVTECFAISYFHVNRRQHFHPMAGRPSPHADYDSENPLDIREKYAHSTLR